MNSSIKGVMPVVIMPYTESGEVHWEELTGQVDHLVKTGCDGVVVGQVSEVLRLTEAERFKVAETIVAGANGQIKTVMSTGGESAYQAVRYSKQAENAGCDALLVMHPSIMALSDEQMLYYYRTILDVVDCLVLIHHAKSMAKRPLTMEVQAQLLGEYGSQKVSFKPESSPTPPKVSELMAATSGNARIFEGDGGMMLVDTFQRGATGVIPATEIAEIIVALWKLLQQNRMAEARQIAYPLCYLMCHMMNSIDCYLGISKTLLKRRGIMSSTHIRPPIDYLVDDQTMTEVEVVYNDLMILVSEFTF